MGVRRNDSCHSDESSFSSASSISSHHSLPRSFGYALEGRRGQSSYEQAELVPVLALGYEGLVAAFAAPHGRRRRGRGRGGSGRDGVRLGVAARVERARETAAHALAQVTAALAQGGETAQRRLALLRRLRRELVIAFFLQVLWDIKRG